MRQIKLALRAHWFMALLMLLWIPISLADGWAERSYSLVFVAGMFVALAGIGEVVLAMLRTGKRWAAFVAIVLALLHVSVAVLLAVAMFSVRNDDVLDYLFLVCLLAGFGGIGAVVLVKSLPLVR